MGTKTISITDEAYDRLFRRKKGNESFSEVICRLTNKSSILAFAGILSDSEGEKLERAIKEGRKTSRQRKIEAI
ncbi:MAG: antitoxin VapB family protein [Candidatus Diapherotrites archaeon]|nr:antitoxin VapB family protein [Candidatus Diapherotrites archaeon]MDZ4255986.1 antitoxin VapB family protein [archaeon]